MRTNPTTTLFLVGNTLEQLGLRKLLEADHTLSIAGNADNWTSAVAEIDPVQSNVLIVVIAEDEDIQGCRQVSQEFPEMEVLALVSQQHPAEDLLRAGATGVVLKESATTDLCEAVHRVADGEPYLSQGLLATMVAAVSGKPGENVISVSTTRTKLHRPPPPPDLVIRSDPLERLAAGQNRPLTLIVAPAGSGKTVLASSWFASNDWPCAWVSLDPEDSDRHQFLSYLTAAIQEAVPGSCEKTQDLLQAVRVPTQQMLATALSHDLDAVASPFLIALDDYHLLRTDSPVHALLDALLARPPIALHLTLISRRDPPLSLTQLRAGGQVTELRIRDLFFDLQESRELIERVTSLTLSEELLRNLQQTMEGWPAGLRLLGLALRQTPAPAEVLKVANGSDPVTREYLTAEIISKLAPVMQTWLCRTSVLDRFCPSLCEAVCQEPESSPEIDGAQFVGTLHREGLFVIPLDVEQYWCRYHHVFQESLRESLYARTTEAERATLHGRASRWFEEHQLVGDAIAHAIHSGDTEAAARIVIRHYRAELNRERWRVVGKWLAMLPREILDRHVELLVAEGWVAADMRDVAGLQLVLDRVSQLTDAVQTRTLDRDLRCFSGYVQYARGEFKPALQHLEHAMAQLPPVPAATDGLIVTLFGVLLCLCGQLPRGLTLLTDLSRLQHATEGFHSQVIIGLMIMHLFSADYARVKTQSAKLTISRIELQTRKSDLLGYALLCTNELTDALSHLTSAVEQKFLLPSVPAIETMAALVLTQQLLGQQHAADRTLEELAAFADSDGHPRSVLVAASCRARLMLLRGNIGEAAQWAQSAEDEVSLGDLIVSVEIPQLTLARVLVAIGSEESLAHAARVLREIQTLSEAAHLGCHLIEVGVLEALVFARQDLMSEALSSLGRAVTLARPGCALRPFIEVGGDVSGLLQLLPREPASADFVDKIVAALDDYKNIEHAVVLPNAETELREPLTNREFDILELIAERLQNKEIAARLYVSTETVKTHLKHVYYKLGVSNRREAGQVAQRILAAKAEARIM